MASAAEPTASVPGGRDGVTLPTASNSISSKRSRDEADDMAVDGFGSPFLKIAKKKAKHSKKGSPEPSPAANIIHIPASSSIPKSDPIVSHTIAGPPMGAACYARSKAEPVPSIHTTASSFSALQERFTQAQYEIADLTEMLHKQAKRHVQEQLWLKQDLVLDMVRRHEHHDQTMKKLHREKHHLTQYANEQKAEMEKQKKKADEEKAKHVKAQLELTYHKGEVEHLQALNKVMEEDLDELRQIENEDAAQRQRKVQGLPPAYGSLDDEDPFATPQLHEDSGSFDVAVFKRTVREDFMRKLNAAQNECGTLRTNPHSTDSRSSDLLFCATSFALSDSCRSLRTALDHAENAFSTKMDVQADKVRLETLNNSQYVHIAKRYIARRDFVADRVAKTILDLSWRVISASELRPCTLRLDRSEKARLNLAYKEVDECLLEALRQTFILNKFGVGKNSLVWEYQHYFTQLSALRLAFNNLHAGISYSFFSKALDWLGEQVETERMNQANRSPDEHAQESARPDWMGGSEISSENARMGNESSAEST